MIYIILFILFKCNLFQISKKSEITSFITMSDFDGADQDLPSFEKKMVVYYNFNKATGLIQSGVSDSSLYENTGKLSSGSLILQIPGSTCDKAAYLYCSEIVLPGDTFQAKPKFGITITAWIILLEKIGNHSIFEVYSIASPFAKYHLEVNSGILRWLHRGDDNMITFDVAAIGIEEKKWTHIAATYNSTTGVSQIYINGVPTNRTIGKGRLSIDWSKITRIGGKCTANRFFGGFIDEFRMYNYVLNRMEIQDVMATCEFRENGPDIPVSNFRPHQLKPSLSNMDQAEISDGLMKRNKLPNNSNNILTLGSENNIRMK